MSLALSWIVIILIAITSVGLLLAYDWRWLIIWLSIQYVGMFILTLQNWPLGMASVKVVAGWMGAAILGMTRSGLPQEDAKQIGESFTARTSLPLVRGRHYWLDHRRGNSTCGRDHGRCGHCSHSREPPYDRHGLASPQHNRSHITRHNRTHDHTLRI